MRASSIRRMMRPSFALLAAIALLVGACAAPAPRLADDQPRPGHPVKITPRSTVTSVLLYAPSRVLDALDVVRAGAEVGPGFGFDAQITNAARLAYMGRTSAGIGVQTLRHLPIKAGFESDVDVGIPRGRSDEGLLAWHRSPADIRIDLHPLIAGAHVAFEPVELVDLIGGFFTLDLKDDDL